MIKNKDYTGEKFGRLKALKNLGDKNNERKDVWLCQCDCGNKLEVDIYSLVSGHTKSCGCLQKDITAKKAAKDLLGQKFGKLTVIEKTNKRKYESQRVVWKCKCDCGKIVEYTSQTLLTNSATSCGCHKKGSQIVDMVGQKFERLTVREFSHIDKWRQAHWKCKCDCGNETIVSRNCLINKFTKSCGCLHQENALEVIEKAHKAGEEKYWKEGTSLTALTSKTYKNNTSGYKGVTKTKKNGKWRASIRFKGKNIYLGEYRNIKDAIKARKKAEEKYFKPILEKYKYTLAECKRQWNDNQKEFYGDWDQQSDETKEAYYKEINKQLSNR